MAVDESRLRAVLEQFAARPDTGAVSVALAIPAEGWSFLYESEPDAKPHFIASVTKLYTAAMVMQLCEENALALDSPIGLFLDGDLLSGLHVYRGVDYSEAITVRQLLAHTSGLPSFLMTRRRDGGTVMADAYARDRGWTFEQALTVVRQQMAPRFRPGTGRRAHFSETNYALLGRIIEVVTGGTWERAVGERIIGPLKLSGTWPFTLADVERYSEVGAMLVDGDRVHIPLTMASVKAQGGLVSTAEDGIVFLRAFVGGQLFDPAYVAEMMSDWRRDAGAVQRGLGIMRFRGPRAGAAPREFIGHQGAPGSITYFAPEAGLYLSGTLNRLGGARLARRLVAQLAEAATAGE